MIKISPKWKKLSVIFLLLVGALFCLKGISLFLREDWWAPRKFLAFPFLIAILYLFGCGALKYRADSRNYFAGIYIGLCIFIIFVFAALNNKILYEHLDRNQRDFAIVNRAVSHLERHPEFYPTIPLAVLKNTHEVHFYQSDTNNYYNLESSLIPNWSKLNVFILHSGYHFSYPSIEQYNLAKTHCENNQRRPFANIQNGIAIVCLWNYNANSEEKPFF